MTAEFEVQQLISRYNVAASAGNMEEAVKTYASDGAWESDRLGRLDGPDAIAAGLRRFTAPFEYVSQINAPAVIAVSGDTATAKSAVRESGKFAGRDEGLEVFGWYIDKLKRTADGWRFVHRRFEVQWSQRVSLLPGQGL